MAAEFASKPTIVVMTEGGRTAVVYDPNPHQPESDAEQVHFTVDDGDLVAGRPDGTATTVALATAEIEHLSVMPSDAGGYALFARVNEGEEVELLAGIPDPNSAVALGRALEREFGLAMTPLDEKALTKLPATKKARSKWQLIWSGLGIVIVLILAASFLKVFIERPKVESAIDEHMKAMKDQDPARAYSMLATRTKTHHTSLGDIEEFTHEYRLMLQAYQSVSVYDIELQRAFANDPSMPQGTVAYVSGEMTFTNGIVEPFMATLEKEDGEWRIFGFFIGSPPEEGSP